MAAAAMDSTAATLPEARSPCGAATGMSPMGGSQQEEVVTLRVHGGGAHAGVVPPGFEGMDSHVLDACPRARLSDEERLMREVARRRQSEAERRTRIFDAKRRAIGMDTEVIDQQCRENAERRKREAELQKIEDRQFMGINRNLQRAEQEKNAARRQAEKAAKNYSLQNLHSATRREYDINDPKAHVKGPPTRVGDEDPRCGPASLQQFNGEDLLKEERKRQQQAATRDAVEQQIFEKQMLKKMNSEDDSAHLQDMKGISDLRNEIESQQAAQRAGHMNAYREELLDRMQAGQERKRLEAEGNQELNDREMAFHASDDLLNEQGGIRPNGKPDKAGYKGSTREERVQVRSMQLQQCGENQMRRAMDGQSDKAHNNHVEMTRKQLMMMEREKQKMRRSAAMEMAMHNQGMVAAQKEAPKGLHKNQISPEFFEQFGVGTR